VTEKPKPPPDDPEQSKRFEQAAIDIEADAKGEAFKRAFETVVPERKPPKRAPKRK